MQAIKNIRFNNPSQKEFVKTLRKRVDSYFKENGITKTGGLSIKIKAVFMFCLYTLPYFLMLFGAITNPWIMLAMTILMGLGMAGIGLAVMHDANHGSFSRKDWLNKFMGFSINFLGGNVNNWKAQHNIMHHTFTNIHGYDEDMETVNILRFSPHTKKRWFHRVQFLYAWPLYGLMTLSWTFAKDFQDIYRYKKKGLLKQLKTSLKKEMTLIIVTRAIYFVYMVLAPLLLMDITWWQLIIGFFTVHFVAGLSLTVIFQMAHIMEKTSFPTPTEGSIKNQWAVHQLETTLNFANKNRLLSWFIGGLNFQIEHHLFPNISHIHYRRIAPIVKATAMEFNLPYHTQRTFRSAILSHARVLYQLGRQ